LQAARQVNGVSFGGGGYRFVLARATIIGFVDYPDEAHAVANWFTKWRSRLVSVSNDYGCGCCVNLWDVVGPAESFAELPKDSVSGLTPVERTAGPNAEPNRGGRDVE
jgi:hypothetical protein